MFELVDLVIDNCAPAGDAVLGLEGFVPKIGAASTVAGAVILNAIFVQVIENLAKRGIEAPVYMSGNFPGGDEHNRRYLAKYKDRIHYLP